MPGQIKDKGQMSPIDTPPLKPVEPKPAATVILLRDGDRGLEVLMLRKAPGKHFAAGAWVFPGGKVEASDVSFAAGKGKHDDSFLGYKIAAIREMYEECGILLARRQGTEVELTSSDVTGLRRSNRSGMFDDLVSSVPLDLATGQLSHFAHWTTPPTRPKRFDVHFFVAQAPADQMETQVDGNEIIEAIWRRPCDILNRVRTGTLKLVLPTMMNILKLEKRDNVLEALAAAREEKVVCVQPERIETEDGVHLSIPAEAGYGVTMIPATYLRFS